MVYFGVSTIMKIIIVKIIIVKVLMIYFCIKRKICIFLCQLILWRRKEAFVCDTLPLSTILIFDFVIVPTMWYFFVFHFMYI
jgi:hypothetical protein